MKIFAVILAIVLLITCAVETVYLLQMRTAQDKSAADLASANGRIAQLDAIGDEHVVELVEALIKDTSPKVRQKALDLVSVWHPERAAQFLPECLQKESDITVRLTALDVAGRLKCVIVTDEVLALLTSKEKSLQRKATTTLGELADNVDTQQRERGSKILVQNIDKELNYAALNPSDDLSGILTNVEVIGKLKCKTGKPELFKVLKSTRSSFLRRATAIALRDLVGKEDEEPLKMAWLNESYPMVRDALQQTLTKAPFNLKIDHERNILLPAGG